METTVVANRTVPSLPYGLHTVAECGQEPWHGHRPQWNTLGTHLMGMETPEDSGTQFWAASPSQDRPSSRLTPAPWKPASTCGGVLCSSTRWWAAITSIPCDGFQRFWVERNANTLWVEHQLWILIHLASNPGSLPHRMLTLHKSPADSLKPQGPH